MGDFYDIKKNKSSSSCLTAMTGALLALMIPMAVIVVAACVEGEIWRVVFCIILMIMLGAEAGFCIYSKKQLERINRYGLIFEEDHDGIITIARLHEMTGIPEKVIRKDLARYAKTNANVTVDGDTVILGKDEDFEEIVCPTCGAKNTVRTGSSDKCNNCGSYLRRE